MYHIHSWSNTAPIQWLEKQFDIEHLQAGTSEEWDDWEKQYKEKHLNVFNFVGFIDKLQDITYWPLCKIDNVYCYIKNRYITKTHYAPTYLIPGRWYEVDHRLLHSMFGLLIDFIEIDKANMQRSCSTTDQNDQVSWYQSERSPKLGIKYLEWEKTLTGDSGTQAQSATDQLELYNWWKCIRPNRIDPFITTGYNNYCETIKWNHPGHDELRDMLNQIYDIENKYNIEDTVMMEKLVEIRHSLWV